MRIAVIGAGISGLGCAFELARDAHVTLYEAAPRLGGHTNTVDVALDGTQYPVDTGFLVFNLRTYPTLTALFSRLGVPTARSEMSFSVSVPLGTDANGRRLEWSGSDLGCVFAQRRNLASPAFLGMLADIVRFNRQATALAVDEAAPTELTLGEFLDRNRYGEAFRHWYLLPMAGAIWSCPPATMLGYPVGTFARFCHNHGLLQISNRPQWYTVAGGARQYVERIAAHLDDVRVDEPVLEVRRIAAGCVMVRSRCATETFDHVVLACHTDQSRRLLVDADGAEDGVLSAVTYQPNRAVLHTDARLMPRLKKVWSAWNYLSNGASARETARVSVTYLLNRLQPLPFATPLLVSLNPLTEPDPARVIAEFDYSHPVFDRAAVESQKHLPGIQGRRGVWFAGAWTGYGFHEDGLKSGLAVAEALRSLVRRSERRAA